MDDLLRLAGRLSVAAYAALIAYAALSDLRTLEIPNWVSIAAFACVFPLALAAGWSWSDIGWNVGAAAAVLAAGFILYLLRLVGAGDIKLLTAATVFGGWTALPDLLVLTTFAGGILALIVLVYRRVPLGSLARIGWLASLHGPGRGIPYGVAIAAAALYLLPYLPLVSALRARWI